MGNGEQLNWGEGKSAKKYRYLRNTQRVRKISKILGIIKTTINDIVQEVKD